MLERLILRNFKQFADVSIELGRTVVFVGPNDSGKTSALQALALWELGVRRWCEKRGGRAVPRKRAGVTINRRDLVALPVPETNLLWRNLHVREASREEGGPRIGNIRLEIELRGIEGGRRWSCGLEFDYANSESIFCRPLGWTAAEGASEDPVPEAAQAVRVAYLPPMSGIASSEVRLDPGAVQVRLGEGRTAEVLRNLCHALLAGPDGEARFGELARRMRAIFGVEIQPPVHVAERGELAMAFRDRRGVLLDLTAAGRGLQQTLLLFAFLLSSPGAVLLLDEPDAHLEILRQKQIYGALTELADLGGSQVIAASHSEAILNEAAGRDMVVAFVGTPHRIDGRGTPLCAALRSIGFEHYFLAEMTGWILYVKSAAELAILGAFAATLEHPAAQLLERPFAHYVGADLSRALDHFEGLRLAKPDLAGLAIAGPQAGAAAAPEGLGVVHWSRPEIENYLCFPEVLEAFAAQHASKLTDGPLFEGTEIARFRAAMRAALEERVPPAALRDPGDRWWRAVRARGDLLDPVFEAFFESLELPNLMQKTDYHRLASLVPRERIDAEIGRVLDLLVETAARARPAGGEAG